MLKSSEIQNQTALLNQLLFYLFYSTCASEKWLKYSTLTNSSFDFSKFFSSLSIICPNCVVLSSADTASNPTSRKSYKQTPQPQLTCLAGRGGEGRGGEDGGNTYSQHCHFFFKSGEMRSSNNGKNFLLLFVINAFLEGAKVL